MKLEDITFNKGDQIFAFWYYDHAAELNIRDNPEVFLKEIKDNPYILITIGKIINNEKDPFYAVISNGAYNRPKKPYDVKIIRKECIIKKELIYTIP